MVKTSPTASPQQAAPRAPRPFNGRAVQRNLWHAEIEAPVGTVPPPIINEALRTPTQPPDQMSRTFLNPRFGHDFSKIRGQADPVEKRRPCMDITQRRMSGPAFDPVLGVPRGRTNAANPERSSHPLPFLDIIQQSFGRHNVSDIRAHTDGRAAAEARALGAEAFARGSDVKFSRTPTLHTAAHEAAHVIQQRNGVEVSGGIGREGDPYERHADQIADRVASGQSSEALLDEPPGMKRWPEPGLGFAPALRVCGSSPEVVQLRRIPPNVRSLLTSAAGGDGENFIANAEGAERLIALAMAELTPVEQATVMTNRRGALSEPDFSALPRRERLSKHAEAIIALVSTLKLGDPALIDTGPRPASPDAANITRVVNNAEAIFTAIASGAQDTNITQVFGAANLAAAKTKYAKGRTWMNNAHAADKIVTDRSGYSDEVEQSGLSGFHEIIRVEPSVIDSPDDNDSVVTLLHESMHAGNDDVSDDLYITATGFQSQTNVKKLHNSAHYEVVPWRVLDPANANAFPVTPPTVPPTFQTFIPAGTTVGGVTAPVRTHAEQGARAAYEKLNRSWALGLNLHLVYTKLFRTPTQWTVPQPEFGGRRFNNSLPFWSKVQKLTIHQKATIDPSSPDEAKHPASQIDVALSEGFTRKLSLAMDLLDPLHTEADIVAFETAKSTAPELAATFPGGAHTNTNNERDFLLKLAVRDPGVGPITGTEARDLRVVRRLSATGDDWTDILRPRNPASFPD